MGGDGQNKGRGRGPPRSKKERKHARQVNAARAAEGLASKSTGSVFRAKGASIDSKFGPQRHGVVLELAKTAPPSSEPHPA